MTYISFQHEIIDILMGTIIQNDIFNVYYINYECIKNNIIIQICDYFLYSIWISYYQYCCLAIVGT